MCTRERSREIGFEVRTLKAYLEYLQLSETGHAADALRDSAGELVVVEAPAAVVWR